MPLYITSHSERWHRTLVAWLEQQWNQPGLLEHYLMQIVCEIRRILSKKPKAVKIEHFKLKFEKPKANSAQGPMSEMDHESLAATASRNRWLAAVGYTRDQPEPHGQVPKRDPIKLRQDPIPKPAPKKPRRIARQPNKS